MIKLLHFDCFSGISGDMCLGALIAAGADPKRIKAGLAQLGIPDFSLEVSQVSQNGIGAVDINVRVLKEDQPHRHLAQILQIIDSSPLPQEVKNTSGQIFRKLAAAEAKVHNTTTDKVHFHEVGAIDALVDIVGTAIALDLLGVEEITVGPLPTGKGFVHCQHGIIPLPAPAVVELLQGFSIYDPGIEGEMVTPTGAAIVSALAKPVPGIPTMVLEKIGYGAGKRRSERPNLLRVLLGSRS